MTEPGSPRHKSSWPVAAWMMLGLLLIAGVVGVTGEILSRSVVLDLVSLWPLALLAVPAAVIAVPLRRGRHRLLALPPLVLITWLISGVALHLTGWEQLPSSAAIVAGPRADGIDLGRMDVEIPTGRLGVGAARGPAYAVRPIRRGGATGPPAVAEAEGDGVVRAEIREGDDRGWFRFAGWDLLLAPGPAWELRLTGPSVVADLTGLTVRGVEAAGSGSIDLGSPPPGGGRVRVDGAFMVSVPDGVPAAVRGPANVPAGWILSGSGAERPGEGDRWTITVVRGATVTVKGR